MSEPYYTDKLVTLYHGDALAVLASIGTQRWQVLCICGHWTPVVGDRRTAMAAHHAHVREVDQ